MEAGTTLPAQLMMVIPLVPFPRILFQLSRALIKQSKWLLPSIFVLLCPSPARSWGFLAHRYINEAAVYLLPPPLLGYMLPYKDILRDQAVWADQRRAWDKQEASRHYMDLDRWGDAVFEVMPRNWNDAILCYNEDSLRSHGILPWHTERVYRRLVYAFAQGDAESVCRYAADLGHYLADAHVPLHLCSNYNGQLTGQHGIHALLESRIPEYFLGKMVVNLRRPFWVPDVRTAVWEIIRESSAPLSKVFDCERQCREKIPTWLQVAPVKNGQRLVRRESLEFVECYDNCLEGLMGQRLSCAITHLASWWWSAWIEAGQPAGLRSKPLPLWSGGLDLDSTKGLPPGILRSDTTMVIPGQEQSHSECVDW